MTDSLGFLISDVSRLLRKRFDERARLIGVTRQQWRTLSVLKRHEGSNQGMLAELLEVEPITLGRMIDRLEEAGWVERRRDPGDRRVWRIHLTDAAQPILLQLKGIADSLFVDAADGISVADQAKLHALLEQLRANLNPDQSNEAANG
ncbi:MAG: MarR family transcriptional regulator [Sphingomonas sp.]|uniref:MarR family winged helix-turn-helix transcriptional regulator n=1 Tax=Sphingomonas sp. TaxID=28214 RepID=UPI00260A62EA|nr:MarR family transcriptional regulator [Sphingomonas sp.]MDK2769019.1 MarR family transcriptional regulator [Sphingomonas sp.]